MGNSKSAWGTGAYRQTWQIDKRASESHRGILDRKGDQKDKNLFPEKPKHFSSSIFQNRWGSICGSDEKEGIKKGDGTSPSPLVKI
ncbi:MAG: hypothetical protein VW907_05530 [Opitutae bacterium]